MEQEIANNLDKVVSALQYGGLIGCGLFGMLLRALVDRPRMSPKGLDFNPLRGVLTFIGAEVFAALVAVIFAGVIFGDAAFTHDNLSQWEWLALGLSSLSGFVVAYYQVAPATD